MTPKGFHSALLVIKRHGTADRAPDTIFTFQTISTLSGTDIIFESSFNSTSSLNGFKVKSFTKSVLEVSRGVRIAVKIDQIGGLL